MKQQSKNNLASKKVFVFDFDGTLINSMGNLADEAANLISQNYKMSLQEAKNKYLATSGLPFAAQLEVLFSGHPKNDQVSAAFENKKLDYYPTLDLFPDVMTALNELKRRNYLLAISSNNGQDVVDIVLADRNIQLFDLVLGYQKNFSKGAQHFNKVLEHFHLEKSEIAFMGDSLHDAKLAIDYGVDFIGRVGTFTKEQFLNLKAPMELVDNLNQLVDLL